MIKKKLALKPYQIKPAELAHLQATKSQLTFGESYTIASIDVGIKNLAYCILSYHPDLPSGSQFKIYQWRIINLMTEGGMLFCSKCKHKAKFFRMESPHAVQDDNEQIPDNNKMVGYCTVHARKIPPEQLQRHKRIDNTTNLELNVDLIKLLDQQTELLKCDEVIMESQPSVNARMKNLSFMIFSYFATRGLVDEPESRFKNICFINSKNKLAVYDGPEISCHLKGNYSRNKYYGKRYCQHLIRRDPEALEIYRDHKKQDDLADCFLQGAWYLKYRVHKTKKPKTQCEM